MSFGEDFIATLYEFHSLQSQTGSGNKLITTTLI